MRLPNNEYQDISSTFLIGPTMGAYEIEIQSNARIFGVGIRPRGWSALLGINASELADEAIDLSDIVGNISRGTLEAMKHAPDIPSMVTAADNLFAQLIQKRKPRNCASPYALEQWLLDPSDPNIDQLVQMMDVSRRQTDRIAKQVFGASPKMLQRKYRALRAADRIRSGEYPCASSVDVKFYDQSHFIKEFRTFIGVTPQQFVHNQAALISTIQKERGSNIAPMPLASL